jgi:hypothetical protein
MYQSAFWAGFIGVTALCSKRPHHAPFASAAFDRPCSPHRGIARGFFRSAKFSAKAVAGNPNPIVHTATALNPRLNKLPKKDGLSLGQKRQGGQ